MNKKRIKAIVDLLRTEYDLTSLPVDLDQLVEQMDIKVMDDSFEEGLSGFAYQKSGKKFIGVNSGESPKRKRFTTAHELGHLFLHKRDAINYDQGLMFFRDLHSSDGTDIKEIEANAFAAELLMPEEYVRQMIVERGGLDLEDEEAVIDLAEEFGVSRTAMTVRLTNLYFN